MSSLITNPQIHIVFASDANYGRQLHVAITSLLLNKNRTDLLKLHVLDSGVSDSDRISIERACKDYGAGISFISVDPAEFTGFPTENHPISTYSRLKIPDFFEDLEKVIYLDCDLLIRTSLRELWNVDLSNSRFAMSADHYHLRTPSLNVLKYKESLNLVEDDIIYNAGVMIWNLSSDRNDGTLVQIRKKLKEYPNPLHSDQCVINILYSQQSKELLPKWNLQTPTYTSTLSAKKLEYHSRLLDSPCIVHFTCDKPWLEFVEVPYFREYRLLSQYVESRSIFAKILFRIETIKNNSVCAFKKILFRLSRLKNHNIRRIRTFISFASSS